MIYLFTSLYWESCGLTRELELRKELSDRWPEQFTGEAAGVRLTVTGVGEVSAAAAVGCVCGTHRPGKEDLLLNVGICASGDGREGIYICNKITELATGRTFYPDMLYRHEFPEAGVVTGMKPWTGGTLCREISDAVSGGGLYDMEAAAVYQAGLNFFRPDQMIFLKVVSDSGEAQEVTKEQVLQRMDQYKNPIVAYIRTLQKISKENKAAQERKTAQNNGTKKEGLVERLSEDMHCSSAMKEALREFIRELLMSRINPLPAIEEMYEKGLLPCKDKREGKLRFEELKRRFF